MTELHLPQAVFFREDAAAPRLIARSPDFADAWLEEAEQLILGYGARPAGTRCPRAVFAQPLTDQHVAVVQVADQADLALGFHFLVIERKRYERLWGDPFWLAKQIAPPWAQRGELPACVLAAAPAPARTVAEVQRVLQRVKAGALGEEDDPENLVRTVENSESPALLGGVQVLVDGGRLVFERPTPDPDLIAGLWTLLPSSTRCKLWPASFAFSNALGFDALVVPRALGPGYEGYTFEDQAADYPQGRYELNLQLAAEAADQRELDLLLNRRSVDETKRLGLTLLVLFFGLALVSRIFEVPVQTPSREGTHKAAAAAGIVAAGDPWTAIGMLQVGRSRWPLRE